MVKMWSGFLACFLSTEKEQSCRAPQRHRPTANGTALGESIVDSDAQTNDAEQRLQPSSSSSGRAMVSPFANVAAQSPQQPDAAAPLTPAASLDNPAARRVPLGRAEQQQQQQPEVLAPAPAPARRPSTRAGRSVSSAVRFADMPPAVGAPPSRPVTAASTSRPGSSTSTNAGLAGGKRGPEWRPSRVRMQLPGGEVAAGREGGPVRTNSIASASGRADIESRALTQLASRLIAGDVHYRAELESIIEACGTVFPKSRLEELLARHSIELPGNRLIDLMTIYQAGDDDDKLDGVGLLKDLDRAVFRRLAAADSYNGRRSQQQQQQLAEGTSSSKKSLAPSVQPGDKARIVSLVSYKLLQDKAFQVNTGGGELIAAEHLQEVVEQMDLSGVAVPIGPKARYVHATDDPESFKVPVWSLRAMHARKHQRERVLMGRDDDLKQLGQAGRDALRRRLTRRSIFQQQEIIANAVVTAARAVVAPSLRNAENSIQASSAPSRAASLQRSGPSASVRAGSLDKELEATKEQEEREEQGEQEEKGEKEEKEEKGKKEEKEEKEEKEGGGGLMEGELQAQASVGRLPRPRTESCSGGGGADGCPVKGLPQRTASTASLLGSPSGGALHVDGGMVVRPMTLVMTPPATRAMGEQWRASSPLRPASSAQQQPQQPQQQQQQQQQGDFASVEGDGQGGSPSRLETGSRRSPSPPSRRGTASGSISGASSPPKKISAGAARVSLYGSVGSGDGGPSSPPSVQPSAGSRQGSPAAPPAARPLPQHTSDAGMQLPEVHRLPKAYSTPFVTYNGMVGGSRLASHVSAPGVEISESGMAPDDVASELPGQCLSSLRPEATYSPSPYPNSAVAQAKLMGVILEDSDASGQHVPSAWAKAGGTSAVRCIG